MKDRPELVEKLSELEILRQSLDDVKAKEKDLYDQLLRLNAEYQNFRKRSETQIASARRTGREDVLIHVISLADAILQAADASERAKDVDSLKKGLRLLRDQFEKFLLDQGLSPIETKGKILDPHLHEAIAQVHDANLEEGAIVDEVQRGYTLNGQIVRPARVRVAAKPESAHAEKKKEEK
ncbi:MAG: nucleotide exchange factor GrpE [Elusimicrobia bacterium]|nr:nucleotide exchange factor GrpE [Elusimicrobiota bacterium]